MQAMLPLIDREECNQPAWHNFTVDDSMVCAGYEEGELGNCYVRLKAIELLPLLSASEMTCIVSSGALNSTHSLTLPLLTINITTT